MSKKVNTLYNMETDLQQLSKISNKYGFKNVIEFADWVEDNDMGEILFGLDQEDMDNGKEEIDKNSMKYRTTMLALDILSLPEVKDMGDNIENIPFDKWLELSRKVKNKKDNL